MILPTLTRWNFLWTLFKFGAPMVRFSRVPDFPEKGENCGLELTIKPYLQKSRLVLRLDQPFADGAFNCGHPREQLPSLTINLVRPKFHWVSQLLSQNHSLKNSLFREVNYSQRIKRRRLNSYECFALYCRPTGTWQVLD